MLPHLRLTLKAVGFGIAYINSPVWIGENVRPELRGFFLCLMNISIVMGQLLLATVCQGIYKIENEWGYRILIILQFAFVGRSSKSCVRYNLSNSTEFLLQSVTSGFRSPPIICSRRVVLNKLGNR